MMQEKYAKAVVPPAVPVQKCAECTVEYPLDSEHFKPNQIMASGYGKRCLRCLAVIARRKRDEKRAERMAKQMADIQFALTNSTAGSPLESELLAHVTHMMGGVDAVARRMADDWRLAEPGTAVSTGKQAQYIGMVKRHTDRVGNKSDIRNMSTDAIRVELHKKIREAIGLAFDENGVRKFPNA